MFVVVWGGIDFTCLEKIDSLEQEFYAGITLKLISASVDSQFAFMCFVFSLLPVSNDQAVMDC